jgi:hypothetical protein
MTPGRNLDIHLLGHEFSIWRVGDDGVYFSQGALTQLQK